MTAEIEVTPAMVEAGKVVLDILQDCTPPSYWLPDVFRAMLAEFAPRETMVAQDLDGTALWARLTEPPQP